MCTISLIFSLLLGSGASAEPVKKIIIVGDSLTEGYGVSHDQAYPALIQKKALHDNHNWMVINSGLSGSTSASAPSRVEWALKQKPSLIILALGANDGLRGNSVKSIEENLTKAVTSAKKAGVKIILAGVQLPPNYGEKYSKDFAATFPKVAKAAGVPLIPFLLEHVGGEQDLNQADGIHPNEKGHAVISETVYREILKDI